MPIAWRLDPEAHRASVTVSDPYTIEEWREAVDALLQDGSEHGGLGVIVDRRGAAPPTRSFVEQMASFFASRAQQVSGVRAAVVVDSETAFGMGRMTGLRAELESPGLTIRPFRSYEEAERWLRRS